MMKSQIRTIDIEMHDEWRLLGIRLVAKFAGIAGGTEVAIFSVQGADKPRLMLHIRAGNDPSEQAEKAIEYFQSMATEAAGSNRNRLMYVGEKKYCFIMLLRSSSGLPHLAMTTIIPAKSSVELDQKVRDLNGSPVELEDPWGMKQREEQAERGSDAN